MLLRRNKKNNVYPVNPRFTIYKWGLRGSKLYRYVFVIGIVISVSLCLDMGRFSKGELIVQKHHMMGDKINSKSHVTTFKQAPVNFSADPHVRCRPVTLRT